MYSAAEIRERLSGALDSRDEFPTDSPDRMAAVLVPLVTDGETRVILTKRTATLSRHAGEVSFPGGLADPGEGPRTTALRESEEELGLTPGAVEVLGSLGAVHTRVLGTLIVPVVGLLADEPALRPSPAEIERVLTLSLADLATLGREATFTWEGETFPTYVFDTPGEVVWGATARILRGLLDTLESPAGPQG
jgi:8-oxo-dGTP pyrophosphatase MutT (NUDIX family)